MNPTAIQVTPYSSAVGALISGVDLAAPLDDAGFALIRQAFHDHGVIFFRDQKLTPQQHLDFARRWAPIDINRFFKAVPGHPEIAEVRKEADQTTNIGGDWHTDHSYDEVPAMGSLLLAHRGADVVHPVVIRHPDTGRKTLYVNAAFTLRFEGWTVAESQPLLQYLYRHASRPEFSCRFEWAAGSLAFWDNRATWHYALNDYHGHRRVMHRITVQGSAIPPLAG